MPIRGKDPLELLDDLDAFNATVEGYAYDLRLDLSSQIAMHLTATGMSQRQLAEAAGLRSPQLTRILHDQQNCTFETVVLLYRAMGIRPHLCTHSNTDSRSREVNVSTRTQVSYTQVGSTYAANRKYKHIASTESRVEAKPA